VTKPKLLLITAISPFPKDSGGAVRIYNTIKNLSIYFDLHLIIFKRTNYKLLINEQKFFSKYCHFVAFYESKQNTDKYSFIKHFQPFWYSQFFNENLIKDLPSIIIKNKIKLVQVEFTQLLYLIKYIPKNIKTIFTAHDISTISTKRRLSTLPKFKTKIGFFLRLLEVFLYEYILFRRYNLTCSVSDHDKIILKKYFNLKNIFNVSNGIESIIFLQKNKNNKTIKLGYFGSFSHPPNETAFIYFLNEIAPLLEKQKISYEFYLAGNNDSKKVNQLISNSPIKNKSAIINLGYVTLPQDFYKHIDILVAPILSGSGTRIKILESLSFGIPVVSSTIGAEGLTFHSKYLQIAKSALDYPKLIQSISTTKFNSQQQIQLKKQLTPYLWSTIFKRYSQYVLK
jgi:glycosyltransferase involved in cell wall biosynthesis